MFPARLELATFRVLGGRDNHYTTETTAHIGLKIQNKVMRPDTYGTTAGLFIASWGLKDFFFFFFFWGGGGGT